MVRMMGEFLETQERVKMQYEDYGKNAIRMTAETSKLMGYNMFATITQGNSEPKRIQIFSISSKSIEHLEAVGAPVRDKGTAVSYQLFFKKFRVTVNGTIDEASVLPQGLVKTNATLVFSPDLVEIIDDYWYNSRKQSTMPIFANL